MLSRRDRNLLFFVFFSVFSSAWVLTKQPAEIYAGYIVFFVLLPVFIMRYSIPPAFLGFLFFFLVTGFINIALDNDTMEQFMKIFVGLMLSYLFYYYVMRRFEFDAAVLFEYYLKAARVISWIGLIQFVSYIVGFAQGYDFRWLPVFNKWSVIQGGNFGIRVNSIFGEPSQYAAVMAPAVFVAMYNLISPSPWVYKRWQSIMVIGVYLLTFSSLGYIGMLLCIILLLVNFGLVRYLLLFIPVAAGLFVYLYSTVPDFRYRWDSTIFLFETGKIDIATEHGSSIVFYNNFVVATENFKRNFIFGTGLGSHPVAFDKYSLTKNIATFGFANNNSDANSMMLRIVSEIGLTGIVLVIWFLRKGFVKRTPENSARPYWIISSATLCIISLYLLRQGHYFLNGFPLFVWLYYYNRKNYETSLEAEEVEVDEEEEQEEEEETDVVPRIE